MRGNLTVYLSMGITLAIGILQAVVWSYFIASWLQRPLWVILTCWLVLYNVVAFVGVSNAGISYLRTPLDTDPVYQATRLHFGIRTVKINSTRFWRVEVFSRRRLLLALEWAL